MIAGPGGQGMPEFCGVVTSKHSTCVRKQYSVPFVHLFPHSWSHHLLRKTYHVSGSVLGDEEPALVLDLAFRDPKSTEGKKKVKTLFPPNYQNINI